MSMFCLFYQIGMTVITFERISLHLKYVAQLLSSLHLYCLCQIPYEQNLFVKPNSHLCNFYISASVHSFFHVYVKDLSKCGHLYKELHKLLCTTLALMFTFLTNNNFCSCRTWHKWYISKGKKEVVQ